VGAGLSDFERCNLFAAGNIDFGACSTTATGCRCHLDSYIAESATGSYSYASPDDGSDGYTLSLTLPDGQGVVEQNICTDNQLMRIIREEGGAFPDTTLLIPNVSLTGGGN
jgi:hypothetical protein